MASVALHRVGSIEVVGVDAISESYGRDFMPHPFAHTRASRFANYDEYAAFARDICGRTKDGDMTDLGRWFSTYVNADIRVECVVDIPDKPRVRVLGHRSNQMGYLAIQNPDEDVVDVYTVSPLELGAAITGSIPTSKPGKHSKVVIPEFAPRPTVNTEPDDVDAVSVRHRIEDPEILTVPYEEVTAFARVQSRWQPARDWSFDRGKKAVVWVRFMGDGDYIYAPGFTHLTPMTASGLVRRVDELIAEDVAEIRAARGLG
ncbi:MULTISPECIES: ESX secretion-associated protein EspG [Mycobacteroides]|uniref:ESX secretion-associated protein EspG n=1 Tax=Mycobacteroides TaxID=670516 RepID=UPI000D693A36|nr:MULTISPECIES: ESX secretion-associated protein EspG [Mycobacteroides]MBF9351500.1 hypothetical protein [Mycobacteroides chelonae]